MENLLAKEELNRANMIWGNGLERYTQENCQVTLTDRGLHIYRPANKVTAWSDPTNGKNNMWGGMRLLCVDSNRNCFLRKGHTYIIKFHVEGKTTNANAVTDTACCFWTNNMGRTATGSGLNPQPSDVSYSFIPANFEGSMDCFYKWTINDDIYKVCKASYSNFVEGETYLSYKHFGFAWNYQNTGEMGTDIYVTNIRMYDLTEGGQNIRMDKNGIVTCTLNENSDYTTLNMYKDGDITTSNIIEF